DGLVVGGRHLAVHAVTEAALKAFGQGVDVVVLGAVGGIQDISRPHGGGVLAPSGVHVATDAVQVVAHELGGILGRLQEDFLAFEHGLAEVVVGNAVGVGRREGGRGIAQVHGVGDARA